MMKNKINSLKQHPLFSEEQGLNSLGDKVLLREMAELLITELMTIDKPALQAAFERQACEQLGQVAHKIKGGALYCGAQRLVEACVILESLTRDKEASASFMAVTEAYGLLDETVEATNKAIQAWLQQTESI